MAVETGFADQLLLHQAFLDKNMPSLNGVDIAIVHQAFFDNGDAVQNDFFIGQHLAALDIKIGLFIVAAYQVPGQGLNPGVVNLGDGAAKQPCGFHQLS